MQKYIITLLAVTTLGTGLWAADTQQTLNFYKKELSNFPAQSSRDTRAYAKTLAEGLETWTLQNIQQPAAQEALLFQTRLLLRAEENGAAVVPLFQLQRLFPQTDPALLNPLINDAVSGLDAETQASAKTAFTHKPDPQQTTVQRQADILYVLSKLSGKQFYPTARRAFESFFQRNPTYHNLNEVELWYGDLHRANGNYLAAISQYKKADELYPNSPYQAASLRLIGDIYADNLHDTTAAKQAYTRVLKQFPDSKEVGVVYKHMAILDENNKQYESALLYYDKAIEHLGSAPSAYEAYCGKADVYMKTKNYQEAYQILHKAAAIFQNDKNKSFDALVQAADLAKMKLKDTNKYIFSLDKALALNTRHKQVPELMYELGFTCEMNGQTDRAQEVYKKLVLEYPTNRHAGRGHARLIRLANPK